MIHNSLFFKEKNSKGLGDGCDPRAHMNQCYHGLHCYRKSDNLADGMCIPMCKNEGYFNHRKRGISEDFKLGYSIKFFSYLIGLISTISHGHRELLMSTD